MFKKIKKINENSDLSLTEWECEFTQWVTELVNCVIVMLNECDCECETEEWGVGSGEWACKVSETESSKINIELTSNSKSKLFINIMI